MSAVTRALVVTALMVWLGDLALASPLPVVTPRIPSADGELKEGQPYWNLSAEHRVRLLRVNPLEVNGVVAQDVEEHAGAVADFIVISYASRRGPAESAY